MTSVSENKSDHKAEPAAEHTVDIHTTADKLADLRRRAEETLHPVGEAAVETGARRRGGEVLAAFHGWNNSPGGTDRPDSVEPIRSARSGGTSG
jgi:hypothetical protein